MTQNRHDNILGTIGRTPVVKIQKLAPDHVNLYVKVEAFNPLGSVKDRLALGVIEAAEASGDLKPGQKFDWRDNGDAVLHLKVRKSQDTHKRLLGLLASYSGQCAVLKPAWLRRQAIAHLKALRARYT